MFTKDKKCTVKQCERKRMSAKYCRVHFNRMARTNRLDLKTPEERFLEKVHKTKTCWLWTGHINAYGYGAVTWGGRTAGAHRVSYEKISKLKIPTGYEIDHLCRVRACVNPSHLEAVTHRENSLRGIGRGAINAKKTHCPKGHPYSGENVVLAFRHTGSRYRRCRQCERLQGEKRR